MQDNKNNANAVALKFDGLPKDIFRHMAPMLPLEDQARTYVSNKSIRGKIKSPYLRETLGLNLPEHHDVEISDHDLEDVYHVLTKIRQGLIFSEIPHFNRVWDDPKGRYHGVLAMVKVGALPRSIKFVCRKHPEIAAICMRVPFLRECLPQAEKEIRKPSGYSQFFGALLGFFVGIFGKPIVSVWKIFRVIFTINLEMSRPLMVLTPIVIITLISLGIISTSNIMLVLLLPTLFAVQGFCTNTKMPFTEKLKRIGMSIIHLFSIIIFLPVNIFRCVIRGYEVGYKQVLQSLMKFVYWDEEQKLLASIWKEGYVKFYEDNNLLALFVGVEEPRNPHVPISQWISAIFPKAWSRFEIINEIFDPTVAELAEAFESETEEVVERPAVEAVPGITIEGIAAMLSDAKHQPKPISELKGEKASLRRSSDFFGLRAPAAVELDNGQTPLLSSQAVPGYGSIAS